MSEGYVYVLFNPSFLDLVKVGRTTRSSEERAAEISRPTGVPSPYIVAYEAFSNDCETLEAQVHASLEPYRVTKQREFFRIPLKETIAIVQGTASRVTPASGASPPKRSEELDITAELRAKYGSYLRPEITSVKIAQTRRACYLITASRPYPYALDQLIQKTDLGFISRGGDRPMFRPAQSVDENAQAFLNELDPYDLIMCTDLFTIEAAAEVAARFESRGA